MLFRFEKRFQTAQEFAIAVRTTIWPKPGTEEVRAGELAASGLPPAERASGPRGASSPAPQASLPAPTPAPASPSPPPMTRAEMWRWAGIILGLAAVGAGLGAWLRLRT